ncbi:hypothetical protein [Pontimicrobium sp. IMCC45349]|uniref:hypothetical protein n=1 Tax=Pontimicrobium sp. IMCC45349 TaxID=3391574 RepID=UPI0039A3DBDF
MKKINIKETIEIVCRFYVFFFLAAYGLGKAIGGQFYTPDLIPTHIESMPIKQIPNFELAWVFMGRSYGYVLFIGVCQIVGATLLLFNRTKLIGTLILIPIMVNVIVFDIFFLDKYGALASAILYLLMLIVILYINKPKIINVIKTLTHFDGTQKTSIKEKIIKYSYVLIIILAVFVINQLIVSWLGYGKG